MGVPSPMMRNPIITGDPVTTYADFKVTKRRFALRLKYKIHIRANNTPEVTRISMPADFWRHMIIDRLGKRHPALMRRIGINPEMGFIVCESLDDVMEIKLIYG